MRMMQKFHLPFYIIGAFTITFFLYILFSVPPKINEDIVLSNIFYFFLSFLLASTIITSFVFYFIRILFIEKTKRQEGNLLLRTAFRKSLRQGFLVSLALSGLAALNAFNSLNPLNAILFLGILILFEFYFSNR